MSTSDPPTQATIDAWLAGELSEVEGAQVEAYFEEHPEEAGDAPIDPDLLRKVAGTPAPEPVVSDLIDWMKTEHGYGHRIASEDAWREVLEPSDDPEIMGKLGHYEVYELIASGGMGIVFRARDPELDRIAAIKVLAPDLATNATARARFLREARAAAKLEHENILPIYGVHDDVGVPYFAMRYAAGGTLQDVLDRGETFDLEQLKSIAGQVAAALGAAHAAGIIHRDIKPANILFDEGDGHVWVCDFGIARSTEDPGLTYAGTVAGTPQYMSPEQAAGLELDGRSDLFSLGAVLYRCGTGEHAFSGTTTASVLKSLATDEATHITQLRPRFPAWFARLLTNLLAKDPRDRPGDAGAIVSAIEDEYSPRPKRPARRRRGLLVGSVLVLVPLLLLQLDAVRNTISQMLATTLERPVRIDGRIAAYRSLREALALSRKGDTILLPAGTIGIDNIVIPDDTDLTLRAADPKARPLLTTQIKGAVGLVSRSPLQLVSLDFELNTESDGDGLVRLLATSGRLEDCRFAKPEQALTEKSYIPPRAIEVINGGQLELQGTSMDVADAIPISLLAEEGADGEEPSLTTVRLADSQFTADAIIQAGDRSGGSGQRISIEASACSFTGRSFFQHSLESPVTHFACKAEGNVFAVSQELCWFRTEMAGTVFDRFRWRGTGNSYPAGNANLVINPRTEESNEGVVYPIAEFHPETGIIHLENLQTGLIEIAGTEQRFTDLATAVKAAPAGATLLLSGRIVCPDEILTPLGQPIDFRAAPGARPTIVAAHKQLHALFIMGPTTVSGIHFVRPEPDDRSLPILGVKLADVIVEDCVFDALPVNEEEGSSAGIGLSFTDVESATVRRCMFRAGQGLYLSFFDGNTRGSDIHVEDSVFSGNTSIHYLSRDREQAMSITAERCVSHCDHFLTKRAQDGLYPLRLSVSDSIVDAAGALLSFPDVRRDELVAAFSWTGRNNHYRHNQVVLETPRQGASASTFERTTLEDFEALAAALPDSSDRGGTFGEPFERSRLAHPVTPSALRAALAGGLVSRAVATLEQLDVATANTDEELAQRTSAEAPEVSALPGHIEIAGGGGRFTDLRTAVLEAPDGATLLLEGTIVCRREVVTPVGKTLHFRAAPGKERPVVVAAHPAEQALTISGPTSLAGITFRRPNPMIHSLPPLGIGGIASVHIEDCRFEVPFSTRRIEPWGGLGLDDVGQVTLRRCVFDVPRAHAIWVKFTRDVPEATDVRLEECVFTSADLAHTEAKVPGTTLRISGERCAAACELVFYTNYQSKPGAPVELDFRDSILDVSISLLALPNVPEGSLGQRVSWRGTNNVYRTGRPILRTYNFEAGDDFKTVQFETFEELKEALVPCDEQGGSFAKAFNRARSITAGNIEEVLNPGIDSPAVGTLELLGGSGEP